MLPPFLQEAYRLTKSPRGYLEEMHWHRLRRMPRNVPATLRVAGRQLAVCDGPSAAKTAEEFFGHRRPLQFTSDRQAPVIYDVGANVGITVLYWKKLYPKSRVVAFEPDPHVFDFLVRNCGNLPNVTLNNAAAWTSDGEMQFHSTGADGGCLSKFTDDSNFFPTFPVKTIRLRDALDEPIDLLKMDIEGAEIDVLADCADRLSNVKRLFVECHSFEHAEQRLDELMRVLRHAGFRVHIENSEHVNSQPFVTRRVFSGKDLHFNLFANRQG